MFAPVPTLQPTTTSHSTLSPPPTKATAMVVSPAPHLVASLLEWPRVSSLPSLPWTLRKTQQGTHLHLSYKLNVYLYITLSVCFPLISNTTTPRRRLSLDMDENAQSQYPLEQDTGEFKIIVHMYGIKVYTKSGMCMTPNNAHLLLSSPYLLQHCRLWW